MRKNLYYQYNSYFSTFSAQKILQVLKSSQKSKGWGLNHEIKVEGQPIFIKRIPLTTLEYERSFSTKNFFKLPNYYHYGIGSAGFGAFRELISHIKITNWVLAGQYEYFPLLYHYRVLKNQPNWKQWEPDALAKYLKYWNKNKGIEAYIRARMEAPYEIVLFLEYIPHSLHSWFEEKPLRNFKALIQETQTGLKFLQQQGILHLDAHFANILTDGKHAYISDFGLALDAQFELSAKEKQFFDHHQYYDQGELISCFAHILMAYFDALPSNKRAKLYKLLGLKKDNTPRQKCLVLLENLEMLQEKTLLSLESEFYTYLIEQRELIYFMTDFYQRLRANPRKNTVFDTQGLERLLF